MSAQDYFKDSTGAPFAGKKVTLMGFGIQGRGLGDARYLAEAGAALIVTDLKSREELADLVRALEHFPNITFALGGHRLEDFRDRDLIVKTASVPLDSPFIAEAKKNGIPVRMSADLFMELSGLPCVGVTGTRGKSTVSHMIYDVLKAAGKNVLLGGNVRGVSNLDLLNQVEGAEFAVLELDSWQCHGLGEAGLSPHVAVFTTFFDDHLNYYKNDTDTYLADKAQIFLYQHEHDVLILGKQCAPLIIEKYGEQIEAKTLVVDELKLPDTWTLSVYGTHNRYNAALALAAVRELGVPDEVSRAALAEFKGVPGRLELVREVAGVRYYNDTTATTPEATLAALSAIDPAKTILILGGSDKGLEMRKLLERLGEVKKVVALSGTGTERIKDAFPEGTMIYHSIAEAFAAARAAASEGDAVLLSPAFASFGMFKNEFDRGDQFNALVNAL